MAWTFEGTKAGYLKLWRSATVKPGADDAAATKFADIIITNEARYKAVQAATGVPWFFIGALHMRESSCNFAGVLHNGERIIGTGRQTSLVPAGRGPFASWEEAAIDAIKLKNFHRIQDWPTAGAPRMLHSSEVFNGLGYVAKGINAPYVWAGTNHEQRGKYVADHVFDPNAEDTQLGIAAVLIRLGEKRPDIAATLSAQPDGDDMAEQPETDNNKQLIQLLMTLLPLLLKVLEGRTPEAKPAPIVMPPGDSITGRPSVGLGTLLTSLIGGMQLNGSMPPPNTLQGFLSLAIPAAFTILSATTPGGATGIVTGLLGLFSRLGQTPK